MRDAAAAAAMSDPDRNRWFRRRWVERPNKDTTPAPNTAASLVDDLALTGTALLQEWRRLNRAPNKDQR